MLTFLKANVARNDISENLLKELFISRREENVKMSLCTMPHAFLDALATTADKIMETTSVMMFAGPSSFFFVEKKFFYLKNTFFPFWRLKVLAFKSPGT